MYKLTDSQKENLKIIEKLTDVDYEINENNEVETENLAIAISDVVHLCIRHLLNEIEDLKQGSDTDYYYDEYVDKILMEEFWKKKV